MQKKGSIVARILLIEDDIPLMRLYEGALAAEHEVRATPSGVQGLLLLSEFKPDIVVQDLNLGDMPGVDILKTIQSQPDFSHIQAVVITGFQRYSRESLPDCVVELLAKPVTISVLLRVVNSLAARTAIH